MVDDYKKQFECSPEMTEFETPEEYMIKTESYKKTFGINGKRYTLPNDLELRGEIREICIAPDNKTLYIYEDDKFYSKESLNKTSVRTLGRAGPYNTIEYYYQKYQLKLEGNYIYSYECSSDYSGKCFGEVKRLIFAAKPQSKINYCDEVLRVDIKSQSGGKYAPLVVRNVKTKKLCKLRFIYDKYSSYIFNQGENRSPFTKGNNNDSLAYYNRGISKYNAKDYEGAMSDYTKAIEINPKYADAYYNRGISKYDLENYQGAISDYTKAIEINPKYADAYNNRGIVNYSINRKDYACKDYKSAISLGNKENNFFNNLCFKK